MIRGLQTISIQEDSFSRNNQNLSTMRINGKITNNKFFKRTSKFRNFKKNISDEFKIIVSSIAGQRIKVFEIQFRLSVWLVSNCNAYSGRDQIVNSIYKSISSLKKEFNYPSMSLRTSIYG